MTSRQDRIKQDAWQRIASILKVDCEDGPTKDKLNAASISWLEYADNEENISPSVEFKGNLSELSRKCGEVIDLIYKTREHHLVNALLFHNNMRRDDTDVASPFGHTQITLLHQLQAMSGGLQKDIVTERGRKGDVPRYISWTMAADLYESKTGRVAYFSRNGAQEIAYDFYEYIVEFCRFTYPGCKDPEDESIAAFSRRRAAVKAKGRDPLLEAMGIPIRISEPN